MYALPGLVDGHSHLAVETLNWEPGDPEGAAARALSALRAGVNLVFDKGWRDETVLGLLDLPPSARPDIEAAGRVIAALGGYMPQFAFEVEGESLHSAVAEAAVRSAGWVKLIGDWPRRGLGPVTNFDLKQLSEAVDVAKRAGCRVAIHTMAREVPALAVAAGVDSIEHGPFLSEGDVEQLGARNGMWVPTLLRMEDLVIQLGAESSGGKLMLDGLENTRRLLPLAVEAGVVVLAGTDLITPSDGVAAEAVRLSEYGMTGESVVNAVSNAGRAATGRDVRFEPGEPADAVFFDEDPRLNPAILAHPRLILRHGEVVA